MIKSTFYNLPDEKRDRIIKAIVHEFSSADSEKVSINRIIKAANISRGSFYQYFDDKVDLVEVLVKSIVNAALEEIFKAVSVSNGDIFYTYEKLLDVVSEFSKDKTQSAILKNLVKNIRANDNLISDYLINRFKGFDELKKLCSSYSREKFRFNSDEDMNALQQILNSILKNSVFKIFCQDENIESVKADFMRKLEIVKRGTLID